MSNVNNVISDVPKDKLDQVMEDLQFEFGTAVKDKMRVTMQPNGFFKVEYSNPESSSPPNSGSTPVSPRWP